MSARVPATVYKGSWKQMIIEYIIKRATTDFEITR